MSAKTGPIELVVVGGSQGSFEALQTLLPVLPDDFACAVVVVLHQHRHGAGSLAQLLGSRSKLPVVAVEDKDTLKSGHVFVAPANYHLLIEADYTFALNTDAPVRFARPCIDVLFESTAQVFGPRAAGIVLSGASTDGALGLKQLKAQGGLVACQDPATAVDGTMPRAAASATPLDKVASPEELGRWLLQLRP